MSCARSSMSWLGPKSRFNICETRRGRSGARARVELGDLQRPRPAPACGCRIRRRTCLEERARAARRQSRASETRQGSVHSMSLRRPRHAGTVRKRGRMCTAPSTDGHRPLLAEPSTATGGRPVPARRSHAALTLVVGLVRVLARRRVRPNRSRFSPNARRVLALVSSSTRSVFVSSRRSCHEARAKRSIDASLPVEGALPSTIHPRREVFPTDSRMGSPRRALEGRT